MCRLPNIIRKTAPHWIEVNDQTMHSQIIDIVGRVEVEVCVCTKIVCLLVQIVDNEMEIEKCILV